MEKGNKKRSKDGINAFQRVLEQWSAAHPRTFPWVGEKDPYKVWLSEIILQQTRVEQGLPYYKRFLEAFPVIQDLAKAEEQVVFRLWQGLGYYNRCKNMIKTAKIVTEKHRGVFPSKYEGILQLPGIGPYTAAAIASFAFDLPYAVVDGNVERFLSRYENIDIAVNTAAGKKYFTELASRFLNKENPAAFNQAMMDFGATVCKPGQPLCKICPFKENCKAYHLGRVSLLPVKKRKIKIKKRYLNYFVFRCNNQVYIRKRVAGDIWQNLHDFPLFESDKVLDEEQLRSLDFLKARIPHTEIITAFCSPIISHQLTHQKLYIRFVEVWVKTPPFLKPQYFPIEWQEKDNFAFPRPLVKYLDREKK